MTLTLQQTAHNAAHLEKLFKNHHELHSCFFSSGSKHKAPFIFLGHTLTLIDKYLATQYMIFYI